MDRFLKLRSARYTFVRFGTLFIGLGIVATASQADSNCNNIPGVSCYDYTLDFRVQAKTDFVNPDVPVSGTYRGIIKDVTTFRDAGDYIYDQVLSKVTYQERWSIIYEDQGREMYTHSDIRNCRMFSNRGGLISEFLDRLDWNNLNPNWYTKYFYYCHVTTFKEDGSIHVKNDTNHNFWYWFTNPSREGGISVCPTGYELESGSDGQYICNKYCPVGTDENCQHPPEQSRSCTQSAHPIDFINGRKYRDEKLLQSGKNFPIVLSYTYNNHKNFRLRHSGGYANTSSSQPLMELRDSIPASEGYELINSRDIALKSRYFTVSLGNSGGRSFHEHLRYNGNVTNYWRHNYEDYLHISSNKNTLYSHDGRIISFAQSGSAAAYPDMLLQPTDVNEYGFQGYRLSERGKPERIFDTAGRLRRVEQGPMFHSVQYSEDGTAIESIQHANGTEIQFEYDDQGRLVRVYSTEDASADVTLDWSTISFGSNSSVDYNLLTNITKTTQGDHVTSRRFEYSDERWPVSVTAIYDSPTGIANDEQIYAEFEYDDTGRAVYSSLAEGIEAVSVAYPTEEIRQVTNALGKQTTYQFETINGVRRLASVTGEPTSDCLESNTHFQYDEAGNVTLKTVNGDSTRYEYNADNLQTKRIEALGTAEERTILTRWDLTLRKPLEVEYPDRLVQYTYDDLGNQLSRTVTPKP